MAVRGTDRILKKLQNNITEGKYYEAHQMYRTLYFRYKSQEKYLEAIDLLYNGSVTLVKHNQTGSGADLAVLLVRLLAETHRDVNDALIDKVGYLHRIIDDDAPERAVLVNSSLKWSNENSSNLKFGHPQLHKHFAMNFWRESNFSQARYHFVRSSEGDGCANMLVDYHVKFGYKSEVDLFITQAVLQFLCLKNKSTAEAAFNQYTKKHPQVEAGPPFVRPLLNFLWLLLLAVDGGKVAVYTVLLENYQPALSRDPSYKEYLDRIGQLFFGLPPPPASQGLFGNLLESLFNVGGDDEQEKAFVSDSQMELD